MTESNGREPARAARGTLVGVVVICCASGLLASGAFVGIAAWGEAHLAAPRDWSGRYRIDGDALAACFPGGERLLSVQQSGVFVRAAIASRSDPGGPAIRMVGSSTRDRLELHGSVAAPPCTGSVRVTGIIVDGAFVGEVVLVEPST